jgi:hypothetical protein
VCDLRGFFVSRQVYPGSLRSPNVLTAATDIPASDINIGGGTVKVRTRDMAHGVVPVPYPSICFEFLVLLFCAGFGMSGTQDLHKLDCNSLESN